MKCPECSSEVVFDGKEVYCPNCGLVVEVPKVLYPPLRM